MAAADGDRARLLDYFVPDYAEARERFRSQARACGAGLHAYPLPTRDASGTVLTVDCAYLKGSLSQHLLIVSSGIHGTEACAGSAIQRCFLARRPRHQAPDLLLVHVLNPYGFAYGRRANENNVDLNRNGLARFPGPPNPAYAALADLLVPPLPPSEAAPLWPGLLRYALRRGVAATVQAIAGGQYAFPRGLFYGGSRREASLSAYEAMLADVRPAGARWVLHIDLHTGLGRYGRHQLIAHLPSHTRNFRHLRECFRGHPVKSGVGPAAASYVASGTLDSITTAVLAEAQAYAVTLEFGTYGQLRLLRALREENRLHHYGEVDSALGHAIKARLQACFCPADPRWRTTVLQTGVRVLIDACTTFGRSPPP